MDPVAEPSAERNGSAQGECLRKSERKFSYLIGAKRRSQGLYQNVSEHTFVEKWWTHPGELRRDGDMLSHCVSVPKLNLSALVFSRFLRYREVTKTRW